MHDVVRIRLALQYICRQTSSEIAIDGSFLRAMHQTIGEVPSLAWILGRLEQEGYIRAPGIDKIEVTALPTVVSRAYTKYLDPMACISHHYRGFDGLSGETGMRMSEIERAIHNYVGGRPYQADDASASYDEVKIEVDGHTVKRQGFYPSAQHGLVAHRRGRRGS